MSMKYFQIKYQLTDRANSCQHVLMHLIDKWRQHLDQNEYVGAVLMVLSKAFDCLPHELLIAKMEAYGFEN